MAQNKPKYNDVTSFMGEAVVDGAIERALNPNTQAGQPVGIGIQTQVSPLPLTISTSINPIEYLQIPNSNIIIAKYEPDWTKGFNYEIAHKTVLNKGLFIPTPDIFMRHFLNVLSAYNSGGNLYDGNANQVIGKELEDVYFHLTKDRINGGAWSWLNGKFVTGTGANNLDLEKISGIDASGNLITNKARLEQCVSEKCFIDSTFNSQGLPVNKSQNQSYIQGQNVYFWIPVKDKVARFGADSGRAGLYCDWDPADSNASLGVFTCAEGVAKSP